MRYIEGDNRFGGLKRKHRDLVTVWVRKEYRNLMRLKKSGLSVPEAFGINENVLVMEYIGDDVSPSPRLRDVKVENPEYVLSELIKFLRVGWDDAKLVHADFSEFNVFKTNSGLKLFDLGSAIDLNHPKMMDFLKRDINNISNFFVKRGLTVENPVDVIARITK